MEYKSPPIGNEISGVMYGIKEDLLNNHEQLKEILLEALKQENFTILNKISHEFKPNGYTLLVLLAESHAAIHTYPEHSNSLYFNIYSCRGPEDGRKTFELLKKELKPTSTDFNERKVIVDENHNT